ncbi:hypothetical protein [Streptomyces sp. NPDC053431]|uniref:hypothetical protein n=1 Tax=Streptomyces sp. NPDC053431 TaxID=3365703 RepID=UPI0037D4725E
MTSANPWPGGSKNSWRPTLYYDKKIAQGKHHTQALLCLARRRADVLFAMLRDGTFYEPRPASG